MSENALPPLREYKDGETIIEQGEPAMEAYLIVSGQVDVFAKDVKIATLHEGDVFGEAALFKGSDYGATIKAAASASVQPILPEILDAKIAKCDPLIRALIRMMMVRLRKTSAELANRT